MNHLFANFGRARVLVVGDIMLDEYLVGEATRISPEAPVPVVEITETHYAAGGAANVAVNAASLGARITLLGVTGQDRPAELLRQALQKAGVDSSTILTADRSTTCKTRVVSGQQQIVRFDVEDRSALPTNIRSELVKRFQSLVAASDLCVLSDYGKGTISTAFCQAAIQIARGQNKPVIVDPKGTNYAKYVGCALVTPNQKEALIATGFPSEHVDEIFAAGKSLLATLPGSSVLITRGPDGMTLFQPATKPLTISTEARRVFDVVGAGDTVIATLAVGLSAGLDIRVAVSLANVAAGIVVGRRGTVAVTAQELSEYAQSSVGLQSALISKLSA